MEQSQAAPVSWEAVKMLALTVGVRESARRMGLSEEAVKRRCSRERWLDNPAARESARASVQLRSQLTRPAPVSGLVPVLSPSAALGAELAALGSESRISLARGVKKAAAHIAEMAAPDILDRSGDVKAIAQTADLVHGWKDAAPQVKIRLDVLGGNIEAPMLDIEATEIDPVTDSGSWDSTDVESY